MIFLLFIAFLATPSNGGLLKRFNLSWETLDPAMHIEFAKQQALAPVANMWANCSYIAPYCPNANISFHLYTGPHEEWLLDMRNEKTFLEAPIIVDAPLKVLIHGYTGNKDYSPNPELRKAYFKSKKHNIISVDWSHYAQPNCYYPATASAPTVGNCTAQMLLKLYKTYPMFSQDNTHVFGFSLGAHVAGFTGKFIKELGGRPLTRITAADPALPLYDDYTTSSSNMVNSNDAKFVDVIHTNAGYKGKVTNLGHVDFYMNNGGFQPGCNKNSSCDHVRAVEYFAESIDNPRGFIGKSCTVQYTTFMAGLSDLCVEDSSGKMAIFGEFIPPQTSGEFHVVTASEPPFSMGGKF